MEELSLNGQIRLTVLNSQQAFDDFLQENRTWLFDKKFRRICGQYGFPEEPLTVIVDNHYVDPAYRDIYYHYLSRLHFKWPRYCKRIFLFQGEHHSERFLNVKNKAAKKELQDCFLGVLVIRPAYSGDSLSNTLGIVLLNPFKMTLLEERKTDGTEDKTELVPIKDENDEPVRPRYLVTREYSAHLLGETYSVRAFPFSGQDGVVLTCAETAIEVLCEYAFRPSPLCAKILPSDIQENLKSRFSQRILPSQGLTTEDISYLLWKFGFSPVIHYRGDSAPKLRGRLADALPPSSEEEDEKFFWGQHDTDYQRWFHYYVESGIPLLLISSPRAKERERSEGGQRVASGGHATLVIGHGSRRMSLDACHVYRIGDLPAVDSASFYEWYIVQNDNQIPYSEERMDHFTDNNYQIHSYVVPLPRHAFLDADCAIGFCDAFITAIASQIQDTLENLKDRAHKAFDKISTNSAITKEEKSEYLDSASRFLDSVSVSQTEERKNPIVIRYFLASSVDYKRSRMSTEEDIRFYASVPMPKFVWLAEISTYKLYQDGYAFAEVALDATASKLSELNSVLLIRLGNQGSFRLLEESYDNMMGKLSEGTYTDLSPFYPIYRSFPQVWKQEGAPSVSAG